jgi:hypothetical protein
MCTELDTPLLVTRCATSRSGLSLLHSFVHLSPPTSQDAKFSSLPADELAMMRTPLMSLVMAAALCSNV